MKLPLLFALLTALVSAKVDYTGHKVVRVTPRTEFQLRYLYNIMQEQNVDFWRYPSKVNGSVDIRTSPTEYMQLAMTLNSLGFDHSVNIEDVGKMVKDEEKSMLLHRAIAGKVFDFDNYHTYDEMVLFLNDLSTSSPLVRTQTIGTTSEGRDIIMARISSDFSANKDIMYFECAMQGREWITSPTCLWMVNELATKYGSDPEITLLLDYADWFVTPVSNPDGYEYTSTDRLWSKNRQITVDGCVGTAANRNFEVGFGGDGSSSDPCAQTYRGPSAFSTPEASAVRDLLTIYQGRTLASVSIHSYGQLWMSPYGYQSDLPADYTDQFFVMEIALSELEYIYGTPYQFGNIADTQNLASGNSVDYAYDSHGVVYSFAVELRDTGVNGFLLPATEIIPTANETFAGLKAMAYGIQTRLRLKQL